MFQAPIDARLCPSYGLTQGVLVTNGSGAVPSGFGLTGAGTPLFGHQEPAFGGPHLYGCAKSMPRTELSCMSRGGCGFATAGSVTWALIPLLYIDLEG